MRERIRKTKAGYVITVILTTLLTMVFCLSAYAKLTDRKTARAIEDYTDWIVEKGNGAGASISGIPSCNVYGDLSDFKKILTRHIKDGKTSSTGYGTGLGFTDRDDLIKYYWSLIYRNNPYVEYVFWDDEEGGYFYGYIYDNQENYLKYKDDAAKLYKKALSGFKNGFKKELAAYKKKYGKLTTARKIACAVNYAAQYLKYKDGMIRYKGKKVIVGGNLYTAWLTHRGICSDYSYLFQALCQAMGIPCRIVMGYMQSKKGSWEPHQWNVVKYNGKYFFVDPTNDDMGNNTGIGVVSMFSADSNDFGGAYRILMIV